MKVNYHTHTSRCKHAGGTEEEYIKVAIERGVERLGFSDHAPVDYGDFVSTCRMDMNEINSYFDTLLSLRYKYCDYIELFIGFEIEYSRLFEKSVDFYKKFPLDYMILGQHFVGCECDEDMTNVFIPTKDNLVLKNYVDQCVKAIKTKKITYLAHPDCINFVGNTELYDQEMTRLINEVVNQDIPIELNLMGVRWGRNYPSERFWKLVKGSGAKVIVGSDAHYPEHLAEPCELEIAYRMADEFKLDVVGDCALIKPF